MGAGIDLSEGAIVGRDFRVVRPLAEGGMGAVYVVEQLSTGKARALKVMHARFAADRRSRERFELEAHASARIASDHVVEVVAAGVDEPSHTPWLVMELLDGETLAEAIARRGAFGVDEAREVFAQLGHALGAAHAVGLVHRDLKPENVVLAAPRRAGVPFTVKVLDFGIAKLVTEGAGSNTQAMGSPRWMAPEQSMSGAAIGAPTDVWALGLIAYAVLTGAEYWRNTSDDTTNPMALFVEVGAAPLVPPSERAAEQGRAQRIPAGFDAWFARCVVREMTARFADAAEATAALLPLLDAPAPQRSPLAFAPTEGFAVFTLPPPPAGLASTTAPGVPSVPPSASMPPAYAPPPVEYAPPAPVPGMLAAPWAAPAPSPPRRRGGLWLGVGAFALLAAGVVVALSTRDAPEGPVTPRRATPGAIDVPFAPRQRWEGSYVCASERTPLVLRVVAVNGATVDAMFEFTTAAGQTGVVRMRGPYVTASRHLTLTPGEWVQQPPGYLAVAMDGAVSPDGSTYSGRMLHPECEGFSLRAVGE
jgi:eukaryotic-like serine/threonine-protein kinase